MSEWKLVPVEPTEDMVTAGFESRPLEGFIPWEVWDEYDAMSGCEQAVHCAKLCYAAMLAAAPPPAVAPAPGNASDAPEVGTHWRHTGGGFYVVEGFANMETEFPVKYPQTIIYRGVVNGKVWARPLADWPSSFTKMDSPAAPVAPDLAGEREVLHTALHTAYMHIVTGDADWTHRDKVAQQIREALASRPQVSAPDAKAAQ